MPSDRNNSPGTPPVSSAGFLPPKTAGEIDPFSLLPSRQETDELLADAAALDAELFAQAFGRVRRSRLLAGQPADDPRYLIVDETPTEESQK